MLLIGLATEGQGSSGLGMVFVILIVWAFVSGSRKK